MAGVYVHIPFCHSRCIYCDFYSQTNTDIKSRFVSALCREIELFQVVANGEKIQSVYFGGGTPSLLSPEELGRVVTTLRNKFPILSDAEWTLEANPDDITSDYAASLVRLGFNRVSLGVQSFSDAELRFLRRRHSSAQVFSSIEYLRKAGIDNISIDLIYAIPQQTREQWAHNVQTAISLGIPHISAYHLIYEEGTPLTQLVTNHKITPANEEEGIRAYQLLVDCLSTAGYKHYEVSNFALEGRESRHNSSYWLRIPYFGFGPSAHSFWAEQRWANSANLEDYCAYIERGESPIDFHEELSIQDQYNEWVMLGLRRKKGIELPLMQYALGEKYIEHLRRTSLPFCLQELLEWSDDSLRATDKGFLLIDGIISDMFLSPFSQEE